jgi:lipopolysaccharide transport system ATP-binding protein
MYVRLAFAVAAHLDPEILLVDEVLAVGDAEFQRKCLGKMGEVAKGGRTVLFVSHNLGAVQRLCQRVILLERNEPLQIFSHTEEAVRTYLARMKPSEASDSWRGDGSIKDPAFVLDALEIRASDGTKKAGSVYSFKQELEVHIEGMILKENTNLSVGFYIYNQRGDVVLVSNATDKNPNIFNNMTGPNFTLVANVPSRLLNEGIYKLELTADIYQERWIYKPMTDNPAVWFEIKGGFDESRFWRYARPGVIAPLLQWAAHPSCDRSEHMSSGNVASIAMLKR